MAVQAFGVPLKPQLALYIIPRLHKEGFFVGIKLWEPAFTPEEIFKQLRYNMAKGFLEKLNELDKTPNP